MTSYRRTWFARLALVVVIGVVVLPPVAARVLSANSAPVSRIAYRGYMRFKGARWSTPRPEALQRATADCGVAVFLETLRQFGIGQRPYATARTDVAATPAGVSLDALAAALSRYGIRSVRTTPLDRALQATPVIALMRYGHFVLVRGATGESVRFFDPLLGEVELSRAAFLDLWSGRGLRLIDPLAASRGIVSAAPGALPSDRGVHAVLPNQRGAR